MWWSKGPAQSATTAVRPRRLLPFASFLVAGPDIFISYKRDEADAYAEGLERDLTALGYYCFRDRKDSPAGTKIELCEREARRSRMFVLVGSPKVTTSKRYIPAELAAYTKAHQGFVSRRWARLVPLNVGHALDDFETEAARDRVAGTPWKALLGRVAEPERLEALAEGRPSASVISRIDQSYGTLRASRILLAVTAIVSLGIFLAAAIPAYNIWRRLTSARQELTRSTREIETRRLTERAQRLLAEGQNELGLLLGIEAARQVDSLGLRELETDVVLRKAVASTMPLLAVPFDSLENGVSQLAFSPNGDLLAVVPHRASGSPGAEIRLWNTQSRRVVPSVPAGVSISQIAFSPRGTYIAAVVDEELAPSSPAAYAWRVRDLTAPTGKREPLAIVRPDCMGSSAFELRFSPDERLISASGPNCTVTVFEVERPSQRWMPRGPEEVLRSIGHAVFDDSGSRLALLGSEEDAVDHLPSWWSWKLRQGSMTRVSLGKTAAHTVSLTDRLVGVVDSAGGMTIRDLIDGTVIGRTPIDTNADAIAFAPKTGRVATAAGHRVQVHPLASAGESDRPLLVQLNPTERIEKLEFNPDGSILAVRGTRVTLLNAFTGALLAAPPADVPREIGFSPDGRELAVGLTERVAIWRVVTDAAIAHIGPATLPVSIARDANGTLLTVGRRAADWSRYTVEVWDVTRPEKPDKRAEFTVEHEPQVVALSPSGNIVAAGEGYGTTSVWSLVDSSWHWTAKSRYGTEALSFTPDGAHLAGAGRDSVFVWDSRTGRLIKQLHHSEMSHSLAFSPRDGHLVTGGLFGKLRCFRPRTYEEYACPYTTENGYAASLAFSRDGTYLAVVGPTPRIVDASGRVVLRFPDRAGRVDFTSDGRYAVVAPASPFAEVVDYRTRVWDVARATEVVGIDHEWPVGDAIFAGGDRYIATIANLGPLPEATEVARAGQAFIWPWRWADLLTQATSRVARNLTRAEWQRFIGPRATYRPARADLPVVDE